MAADGTAVAHWEAVGGCLLLIVPCLQELQLPKSIITRLAKGVLPPNTQIQANAILAMTKSATVFINHLANAYGFPPPLPRPLRGGLPGQIDRD